MSFSTSLTFYLVFGACVAAAIYLRAGERADRERGFRNASAFCFWPLYMPLLLERPSRPKTNRPLTSSAPVPDSLAQAIQQVESELDAALGSLDGWAEEAARRRRPPTTRVAGCMAIPGRSHSSARRIVGRFQT